MGSDVRKLAYDGYVGSNILGTDVIPEYLNAGHVFYGDAETSSIKFLAANIFDAPASPGEEDIVSVPMSQVKELSQLRGSLTHIYAGAIFHIFDEKTQFDFAYRLAILLKRVPGSIIFGRHQGLEEPGMLADPPGMQ